MVTAGGRSNFKAPDVAGLEAVCEVRFRTQLAPPSPRELHTLLADAEFAALTHRAFPDLHAGLLPADLPLRGVTIYATGHDRIDLASLTRRRILVSHLPDYSVEAVAEQALGLMLTLARRIHLSSAKALGQVPASVSLRGSELRGKTLGIVGCGRTGLRVAELARAFGMAVIGHDPQPVARFPVEPLPLEVVWQTADWISLHHPAKRGAPCVYGHEWLRRVKPGAFLINVSRAGLVDPGAVLAALHSGRLAGYAVDDQVFSEAEAGALIREGRILQTGHSAWYSQEALERGYQQLLGNLRAMATGQPCHVLNPEAWQA